MIFSPIIKKVMKNAIKKEGKPKMKNQAGHENISYNVNKHRPEIRDDLIVVRMKSNITKAMT